MGDPGGLFWLEKKKGLLEFSSKDQEIEVTRDPTGNQRWLPFLRMVAEATDLLESSYACLVGPIVPKRRAGKSYTTLTQLWESFESSAKAGA